jgi:hypothetical protein
VALAGMGRTYTHVAIIGSPGTLFTTTRAPFRTERFISQCSLSVAVIYIAPTLLGASGDGQLTVSSLQRAPLRMEINHTLGQLSRLIRQGKPCGLW